MELTKLLSQDKFESKNEELQMVIKEELFEVRQHQNHINKINMYVLFIPICASRWLYT